LVIILNVILSAIIEFCIGKGTRELLGRFQLGLDLLGYPHLAHSLHWTWKQDYRRKDLRGLFWDRSKEVNLGISHNNDNNPGATPGKL